MATIGHLLVLILICALECIRRLFSRDRIRKQQIVGFTGLTTTIDFTKEKRGDVGTALPGFKSCKPPWLRLSERLWDHKPLRRQSLSPRQGHCPSPLYFTLLGPEPDQLANDG